MEHESILVCVLEKLFPDAREREQVAAIMSACDSADPGQGSARVKIAILKLAGADPSKVALHTKGACVDFRDVLSAAEYPNQSGRWSLRKTDPERYRALVSEDERQYRAWIDAILSDGPDPRSP